MPDPLLTAPASQLAAALLAVAVIGWLLGQRRLPSSPAAPEPAPVSDLCPECGRPGDLGPARLMCPACWALVPEALQRDAFETWIQYREGGSAVPYTGALRSAREAVRTAHQVKS
jgi:hypothetical protein